MSEKTYPHLPDATAFPALSTVDPYAIKVQFDYTRWDKSTEVVLCNVPWCGDYENVVKFATDAARDAYFDELETSEKITLQEAHRILADGAITLPVPFDALQGYNYVCVEYPLATGTGELIDYETVNGRRKYFFFITDTEYRAPNATRATIRLDVWTTYINSVDINYCMLERGHAPMSLCTVAGYLANPLANADSLLCPDVNFGSAEITKHTESMIANDSDADMAVIFYCTSQPYHPNHWGTQAAQNWTIDGSIYETNDGCPNNLYGFYIDGDDYPTFMTTMWTSVPQFACTVVGICLCPVDLLDSVGDPFTFCGTSCHELTSSQKDLGTFTFEQGDFGYDDNYKALAKLYTSPYAKLLITDGKGNSMYVRIEDTTGSINVDVMLNTVFPGLKLAALFSGIGGSGTQALSFKTLTSRSIAVGGSWYDFAGFDMEIPIYALTQDGMRIEEYQGYYARCSSYASNGTAQDNAQASADLGVTNTSESTAAASTCAGYQQSRANTIVYLQNAKLDDDLIQDQGLLGAQFVAGINNNAMSAITNVAQTGGLAAAAMAVGAVSNPYVALAGAGLSIASSVVNYSTQTGTQTSVYNVNNSVMIGKTAIAKNLALDVQAENNGLLSDTTATNNAAAAAIAANSRATAYANAARTKATSDANVDRTIQTGGMRAPQRFGAEAGSGNDGVKPLGLHFSIVTQRDGEIAAAGDQMLRYGYMYNRNWSFTPVTGEEGAHFNIMSKFTFWKMADLWLAGAVGMIEGAQQVIKDILCAGVTVWGDPRDIGTTSIYDNPVA